MSVVPTPIYIRGIAIKNNTARCRGAHAIYWGEDSPKKLVDYIIFDAHEQRAELHAIIRILNLAAARKVEHIIIYTKLTYLLMILADLEMDKLKNNNWKDEHGKEVEHKDLLEKINTLRGQVNFTVLPLKDSNRVQTLTKSLSSLFAKIGHRAHEGTSVDTIEEEDYLRINTI
uniref:RNase H type-1 domain-containing protein n=1 Tax=Panagrolaimus sp. JU765 TaxID=591449 RepID=A0AC34R9G8_9BILA